MMPRYFWRNDRFEDAEGNPMPMPENASPLSRPYIIPDIPDYRSPIDGRLITTRSERREDLRRNGCVEYEPSLSPTKGKFKNKRFAKKYGLPLAEEYRD